MADTEVAEAGPPADAGPPAETASMAEPGPPAGVQADIRAEPDPAAQEVRAGYAQGGAAAGESALAGRPARTVRLTARQPVLHSIGVGLLLLAIIVLGFAGYLYGLSSVQEARTQTILYTKLQAEMAGVQGEVAPLGPATPPGAPMAILDIPSIGMHDMVVVEGTTPEDLMAGPGHRPDTPLPGQPGVAVIYGRRATFGAPFGRIPRLRPGDTIKAITGQGSFTYTVAAVAMSNKIIQDPAPNRLLLLTASSATIPSYYIEVDADLSSSAQPSPGVARIITPSELPLAGDGSALALTMSWALALALVSAGGTVAALRWSPWVAYLAATPVALAVLWNLYQSLAALLPNLY